MKKSLLQKTIESYSKIPSHLFPERNFSERNVAMSIFTSLMLRIAVEQETVSIEQKNKIFIIAAALLSEDDRMNSDNKKTI
jgi:hypothetical protein